MIEADRIGKSFRVYARPRHFLFEKLTGRQMHREVEALTEVSFKVGRGQCLGVIGQNGAGKSTLLRVLAGISPSSSGSLKVEGRVSAILELDSGFHPEFTGRENIRMGAAVLGLSKSEAADKEAEIIAFSELGDFIDLPVRTYSTGMYLRLGFSLATIIDPEVLLVDEALAVGDEWFRGKCVDRIIRIKKSGAAVVIVSHDLTMVRALCDESLLLDKGRTAASGKTPDVINRYLELIYESAAATAGKSSFSSDRPRLGSGELEITAVRVLGKDGRETSVLRTGEPMAIEFDYLAHQALESPLFGVNVFRSDGVLSISTNSEATHYSNQKYRPGVPPGDHPARIGAGARGTAGFYVESNPLLDGGYELSVNVYRGRSGSHLAVDEILGALRFQVVSGDHADRGLFLCPGAWKIG